MQRRTSTHSDSSDDDDDLPSLSSFSNITIKKPQKKTFEELFNENADLIKSLETQRRDLEQIAALQTQDTLKDDDKLLPGDEDNEFEERNEKLCEKNELDDEELDETDAFEEPSVCLFGDLNYLQFITWDDLTLQKCGFDSTLDFTELESLLIELNENELQEEIKCGETFSPKNFKQLNPFVLYVFKTMSLHSDAAYVNACQKFIKKISKNHCVKNVSIIDKDIFKVLFNYGVDVKKEIFSMLPGSKQIQTTEIINEIPKNWMFNLKAVLSSIGDLLKHCKVNEDDLFNILIYFLWMSMDDFLNINMALQLCTEIILHKFSKMNWPVWRIKIAQFVMSANQWNLVLKMIKCIHHDTPRGIELCNYLSYLALRKLTDGTSDSNVISKYFISKYSEKLFSVGNLQPILKSVPDIKKGLQLVAIQFINLFTMSLKLSSKEEHSQLLLLLKKCENSISKHATIQQSRLCIIHSRISTLTPNENMKQMFDAVEKPEKMSDGDEDDTSMYDLEIDDTPQSVLDEQSLSEESRELRDLEMDNDTPQSVLNEQSLSEESRRLHNLEMDNDTPQSVLYEQSLSEESRELRDLEIDNDTPQSLLDVQSNEESSANLVNYTLDDTSQKQDVSLQNIITDQSDNQEVTEELPPKEKYATINDGIVSQPSLDHPLVNKQLEKNPVLGISKELLQNVDDKTSKGIVTNSLEVKKEAFENVSPEENWLKVNDVAHLQGLNEMSWNRDEVALEFTVSSTMPNGGPSSNVAASLTRLDAESDRETESSSEIEDCKSDEKMNSGGENYITPSKSFLIDHHYTNKKWPNNLSANPSKNLNACFDKLPQSSVQSKDKLLHTAKNLLEISTNDMEQVKMEGNLSTRTKCSSFSFDVVGSEIEKIISKIQNNSTASKTLQNSTSFQNLIPNSENSRDLQVNKNFISNIQDCDKPKPTKLIKSHVDNTEAVFIDSKVEKIISKIDCAENKILHNLTFLPDCISGAISKNSKYSTNKNVISVSEHRDKVNPPVGNWSIEANNTEAVFIDSKIEKIISEIDSAENKTLQNQTSFQNLISSAISENSRDPLSNKTNEVDNPIGVEVFESNSAKNVTVTCELTIPEVKSTDGSSKVISDDSTAIEKSTSSIIMCEKDLDPLYDILDNNPNPLGILMEINKRPKEDSHFGPRSVEIKAAKTMHSSDFRISQNSENESSSNSQNLVETNEFLNSSEKNKPTIDIEMDLQRRKGILQISESNKTPVDKAEIDIFNDESETVEKVNGTSFKPNIVHLRSIEDTKDSDTEKINNNDNENQKKFYTPSLNNILGENQEFPTNNGMKHGNKPMTEFNFDHNEASIEHQSIAFPSKQQSQTGSPNTSSPKRKHTDSISNLTSKRPKLTKILHLGNLPWEVNFPALSTPVQNLNKPKKANIGSIVPVAKNASSVYYTEICNSKLGNEIPATWESSEVMTDHSNNTESVKIQDNSEINTKNLSDSDSGSSSDSDSSSYSSKTSSSSISSGSKNSKSQSVVPNTNNPNNQAKRSNSLKDSQSSQHAITDFVESISSDSEEEIQILEEISNIKTNAKQKSNNNPSFSVDKRLKYTSLNSTRQIPDQNSIKTPTKPQQSILTDYYEIPRNGLMSLFNFPNNACPDYQPNKSNKPESRTTQPSIKTESRTPKKVGNPEQRAQKNPVPALGSLSVKMPRLSQSSFASVPGVNTSIFVSPSEASCSQYQDDDIQILDNFDIECLIVEPDNGPKIITID